MTAFSTRVTFDHIRNSAAGFTSANPILGYGVTGLETDTGRIKIGDGVTPWNSLVYSTAEGLIEISGITAQTITIEAGANITVATAGSTITISAAADGQVASVNGQTGVVVLTSASVSAASAVHSHVISDVTGLQSELDGKAAVAATNVSRVVSLQGLTGTITITGVNLTVATAANEITLTAGGGGGGDPVVTSVSITASVNDYSLPTGDIFRISHGTTNTVEITGLATAVDGAAKLLINVSTGASSSYTIKHANTNSTAVSQILVPWQGDYVVSPNGGAALVLYDATDSRWRVV